MENMKEEEQKLKEEIFKESLKVNEEIKEALCRLSRKSKEKNEKDNREER